MCVIFLALCLTISNKIQVLKLGLVSFALNLFSLTEFEKSVLIETAKMRRRDTASYSQLAKRVGCINGQRTVGNALNKNPLPVIIPCHRVVGSKKIMGYKFGNGIKRILIFLKV